MAEHVFSLLCGRCIIDSQTNNLSAISVTEQLNIEALPAEVPDKNNVSLALDLVLVTLWRRSDPKKPERLPAQVQLVGPDGRVASHFDFEADLSKSVRTRHLLKIRSLPFRGFGTYRYVVRLKEIASSTRWRKLASLPVDVVPSSALDLEKTFLRPNS